jgi:uncharacterized membrane protein
MKLFVLILLFLVLPTVIALDIQVYSINFDVQPDMKVREEIKIVFSGRLEERNLTYSFSGNAYKIKANDSIQEIETVREKDAIVVFVKNGTRQVYLSFETDGLVKGYNDGKEFLTYLYLPKAEVIKIYLWLPKGHALYKDGVIPEGEIITDGERIGVYWKGKQDTPLIVRFYQIQNSKVELIAAALLLIVAAIIFVKLRKDDNYLLGFSSDEVRVIEFLKEKKVVYQNKLEKELGFSRAKMTRIVKKLEEKGLVEKERTGRTNKIKWK